MTTDPNRARVSDPAGGPLTVVEPREFASRSPFLQSTDEQLCDEMQIASYDG